MSPLLQFAERWAGCTLETKLGSVAGLPWYLQGYNAASIIRCDCLESLCCSLWSKLQREGGRDATSGMTGTGDLSDGSRTGGVAFVLK